MLRAGPANRERLTGAQVPRHGECSKKHQKTATAKAVAKTKAPVKAAKTPRAEFLHHHRIQEERDGGLAALRVDEEEEPPADAHEQRLVVGDVSGVAGAVEEAVVELEERRHGEHREQDRAGHVVAAAERPAGAGCAATAPTATMAARPAPVPIRLMSVDIIGFGPIIPVNVGRERAPGQ